MKKDSFGLGFLFALGAHAVFAVVVGLAQIGGSLFGSSAPHFLNELAILALVACGVVQLVYLIPLAFWLWRTKRPQAAKGVLLAMALLFLVNAACWGLVSQSFGH